MAATHQFSESNGIAQTITDGITNLNFGSLDATNLNTITYPISQGTNSFSKYVRSKFTSTWTQISNMKFWMSAGVPQVGETVKAAANVTYATPAATSTGDSNAPTIVDNALEVHSFEGLNTIDYGESGVSGYTGYVRLQIQTTMSTPAGAVNEKQFTFQYDEI